MPMLAWLETFVNRTSTTSFVVFACFGRTSFFFVWPTERSGRHRRQSNPWCLSHTASL